MSSNWYLTATFALGGSLLLSSCLDDAPSSSSPTENSAIGVVDDLDPELRVVLVESELGGNEGIAPGQLSALRRHGGGAELIHTFQRGISAWVQGYYGGVPLNFEKSKPQPGGGTIKNWIVPLSMHGTSQTFRAEVNGSPLTTLHVLGTRSCEGLCGQRAPEDCYCDSACFELGDCCNDKELFCGQGAPTGQRRSPRGR